MDPPSSGLEARSFDQRAEGPGGEDGISSAPSAIHQVNRFVAQKQPGSDTDLALPRAQKSSLAALRFGRDAPALFWMLDY